ncbi:hypothetical protein CINS5915_05875 [Campylobacter insulaenigrae]|uniref:hypothetical protein n=1 Tax=Campylobacter insulaenigrae TaxID=260714 RepID=UPI0021524CF1|nr:hypothetical protein [Campylobacter insulaenigrae]MCR6574236.1 hypothetical protein [Campylobacter insulaenigrae]MCR6575885.1 hypothetical protein [Campylobacter insulaenigrae]MCR6580489.1 hypothetical protein [Campylobacter insulaenigrae]MCR6585189.1 hypothetical protein [Campylobacter insulaenigrae]MCR6586502.1 hypothetical protein [Campylobacter insulaenigrae]
MDKEQIDFINKNYKIAFKNQIEFLGDFVDYNDKVINEEERKKYIEKYKKTLQRNSPQKDIYKIYKFLLKNTKIKKYISYKPLINSNFEKKY